MYPDEIEIPMLMVGGWFDHNTQINLEVFESLVNESAIEIKDQHKLLMGPWVHGGTGAANVGSSNQGDLSFPEAAGWNALLGMEFFDHYLRDIDNGWEDRERYTFFQMGEQLWRESSVWPPQGTSIDTWYLQEDLQITTIAPTTTDLHLDWAYDPEDPSPTIGGKTLNLALLQGPYDQAEVELRQDALVFTSPVWKRRFRYKEPYL